MISPVAAPIEDILERLQGWVGRTVVIETSLSRVPSAGHDRQFAPQTRFAMQLESVGVRFSGMTLWFAGRHGEAQAVHEVALNIVPVLEFATPDTLVAVERFGPELERRTTILAREAEPDTNTHSTPENFFSSWWRTFRATGDLSPVRLGCTREDLQALFGEPDAVGGTSRKYRTPRVWKYGELEFHFGPPGSDLLSLIYSETPEGVVDVCIPRRV